MTTLVLCGHRKHPSDPAWRPADQLEDALAPIFRVMRVGDGVLRQNRSGKPDYLIVESVDIKAIEAPSSILILQSGAVLTAPVRTGERVVAIVDSSDGAAVEMARSLGMKTITLGSLRTDTMSYSSKDEDSMVISLQRSVHSLSGRLYEPAEIPIRAAKGVDPHAVLLLGCVLLLSDRFEALAQVNPA